MNSVIADPKFVDARAGDFRLQPDSPALKLGFQPIDVTQAGLTGPPELVKLARSIQRPAVLVPRRESVPPLVLDEGFENTPLGMSPDHATTYGEQDDARIRVTDEAAASGKRSLKFTDARGPQHPWNPHIFLTVSLPGQTAQRFENLPCDPQCRLLEWLGFVSVATDRAVFYLDNLKLDLKR